MPSERQSRQKGVSPGGFERTTFQDVFLSSPREARKADFRLENPRLWKIFPFAQPSQSLPVIRGQRKARPYPPSVQASPATGKASHEADALARASAFSSLCDTTTQALEIHLFKRLKGREFRAPTPAERPPISLHKIMAEQALASYPHRQEVLSCPFRPVCRPHCFPPRR